MSEHAPVAVGVDVGGTKLVAATVAADGTVRDRRRTRTPADDERALLSSLTSLVGELTDARGPLPVGVGIAGIVTAAGTYRYGPNLAYRDVALADELHAALAVPVRVVNDVTAAVAAEQRVGAARGRRDVVMLTLGTGVGGGIVIGGQPVTGVSGAAAELGHVIVCEGGRPCPCGNRGCLEAYASGRAIGRAGSERVAARAGDGPDSALREHATLTGKVVTAAAVDGDWLARQVLAEAGFWLGVGIASVVNTLDPEVVVVGGGAATRAAPWLLPAAETALAERLIGRQVRRPPPIVLAELGDDAGMIGAALLAAEPV